MSKFRLTVLILFLSILIGSASLLSWLYKTVQINVDGQIQQVKGFIITVQGGLRMAGISLAEKDSISPPLPHWLKEGEMIYLKRAKPVMIWVDRQVFSLFTAERVPVEILKQAGLQLNPGDILLADGKSISLDQPLSRKPSGEMPAIQVQRAISFVLQEEGEKRKLQSRAITIGKALWENGISVYSTDLLLPGPENLLTPSLEVQMNRAFPITITIQNQTISAHVIAETVGEALMKAGYPLQGLDYSVPSDTSPVPADGKIRVVKVSEEVILEKEPLPYENQYQPVSELPIDQQQLIQAGEYGIQARRIRVRYEDGIEISRQTEGEWIAQPPRPQITGYGTKIEPKTIETPDGTITYWRALQMYAVSYHPAETGSNVTASGMILKKGIVAVDTRYIPFYTRLYIPGYGEAVAGDRGGGVIGRIIDLGYSDQDYVPWHQNVTVYFLWPPPENIVWIIP